MPHHDGETILRALKGNTAKPCLGDGTSLKLTLFGFASSGEAECTSICRTRPLVRTDDTAGQSEHGRARAKTLLRHALHLAGRFCLSRESRLSIPRRGPSHTPPGADRQHCRSEPSNELLTGRPRRALTSLALHHKDVHVHHRLGELLQQQHPLQRSLDGGGALLRVGVLLLRAARARVREGGKLHLRAQQPLRGEGASSSGVLPRPEPVPNGGGALKRERTPSRALSRASVWVLTARISDQGLGLDAG